MTYHASETAKTRAKTTAKNVDFISKERNTKLLHDIRRLSATLYPEELPEPHVPGVSSRGRIVRKRTPGPVRSRSFGVITDAARRFSAPKLGENTQLAEKGGEKKVVSKVVGYRQKLQRS